MFPASLKSNLSIAKVNTLTVMVAGSAQPIDATALGIAIITENLRMAARAFIYNDTGSRFCERNSHAKQDHEEIKNSLIFVQGSGLEMVVVGCNLYINPDELREKFYRYCFNMKIWKKESSWNLS